MRDQEEKNDTSSSSVLPHKFHESWSKKLSISNQQTHLNSIHKKKRNKKIKTAKYSNDQTRLVTAKTLKNPKFTKKLQHSFDSKLLLHWSCAQVWPHDKFSSWFAGTGPQRSTTHSFLVDWVWAPIWRWQFPFGKTFWWRCKMVQFPVFPADVCPHFSVYCGRSAYASSAAADDCSSAWSTILETVNLNSLRRHWSANKT